ncbi:MAG: hypothetical protein KDB63_20590 [Nocardioidaceae bacterium]|nr:hypothetical protein [Nocardioidaceae bacterium]
MTFFLILILVPTIMVSATLWALIRRVDSPVGAPRSHFFDTQLAPPSAR